MKAHPGAWYTICCEEGKIPVKKEHIVMLRGDGCSVTFYIKDENEQNGYRTIVVGKHLKKYEDAIDPDLVRVNQRHIINLNYVIQLKRHQMLMRLPEAYLAAVTRTYRQAVYKLVGLNRAV